MGIEPRRSVAGVKRYSPPLEGRRGRVRLDFNENTEGFPWAAPGLPLETTAVYPEYGPLLEKISAYFGLDASRILLTNGAGEGLFLASFTFLEPGEDAAVTSAPTFSLIPHFLRIVGAQLVEVPCTETCDFDTAGIEASLGKGAKLAVFASPENPTGAVLGPETVKRWALRFPGTLFVIDEAYGEYGAPSALPHLDACPNLLVLRTFAKAFGMAGLRLGVALGDPGVIEAMARVKLPYSVNAAAVSVAMALLDRAGEVKESAASTMARKDALARELARRGWPTVKGHANFLLLDAGLDAAPLTAFCRERGVLLRDRSALAGTAGKVRVTAGTEGEHERLLDCLDAFREKRALILDLDDTLVDTSASYDAAVASLVQEGSGAPLEAGELASLRAEGGFNDDWDAAKELLRRRGVETEINRIARRGKAIYLASAREREFLLVPVESLRRLGRFRRLLLYTGRTRDEYEPVWGDTLTPLFERVACKDDLPGLPPKPAPDQLRALMREQGIEGGAYVGNLVDDMRAATGAGLTAVAVATTHDEETLRAGGAEAVLGSPKDLERMFPHEDERR